MDTKELENKLDQKFGIRVIKELGNSTGNSLKLENGVSVNLFNSGNHNVQGKKEERELVEEYLNEIGVNNTSKKATLSKRVFVVYGHDKEKRTNLENELRKWNFEPVILEDLANNGQTVIEKLENNMVGAAFGVVIASPDDIGYEVGHENESKKRARQNVVLEMGMLLSKFGRKKVFIFLESDQEMEKPSDISGLLYLQYNDDIVRDTQVQFAKSLGKIGYDISADLFV